MHTADDDGFLDLLYGAAVEPELWVPAMERFIRESGAGRIAGPVVTTPMFIDTARRRLRILPHAAPDQRHPLQLHLGRPQDARLQAVAHQVESAVGLGLTVLDIDADDADGQIADDDAWHAEEFF